MSRLFAVLIGAAVRGGALLLLATVVARLWSRGSAAQRHLVWAIACYSLLLLPVLSLVVPPWRVSTSVPLMPAITTPLMDGVSGADLHPASIAIRSVSHDVHTARRLTPASRKIPESSWLIICLGVWGTGTLVALAMLVDSQRRVRRLMLDAPPLTEAWMLDVLDRAKSTIRSTGRVPVKVHTSPVPMVCGVFCPAIVLPVSACTWDKDRLYNVLLHELAHIKRSDCLTQTVAFLTGALYWFNPLVWLAVRRLQVEQEQACDDAVLAAGSLPREYATDLLELMQAFRSTRVISLGALPFARSTEMKKRMLAIIDQSRSRRQVSRWGACMVWSAGLGIVYPLLALTPHKTEAVSAQFTSHRETNTVKPTIKTALVASTAATLLAKAPVGSRAQAHDDSLAGMAKPVPTHVRPDTVRPIRVDTFTFLDRHVHWDSTEYMHHEWERTTFSNGNCSIKCLVKFHPDSTRPTRLIQRFTHASSDYDYRNSIGALLVLNGAPVLNGKKAEDILKNIRASNTAVLEFLDRQVALFRYGIDVGGKNSGLENIAVGIETKAVDHTKKTCTGDEGMGD